MFYKTLCALYMPFFNLIHFCFQINYSSVTVLQKNRRFGMKNEANQKMRCIMHTGSYRKIFYHLSKSKVYSANTFLRKLFSGDSRREVHQWKLKKGDCIDWSWDIVKNEMVVIAKKDTSTNNRRKPEK